MKNTLPLLIACFSGLLVSVQDIQYTETSGREAWKKLRSLPVNETSFRTVCDLIQDVGRTHLNVSYEILTEYVPIVRKAGTREQVHILLMAWGKAKGSLGYFEEAEKIYREARENARGAGRIYRETLVSTALLYGEWVKNDSMVRYLDIGEKECAAADDRENLSFIYTFRALSNPSDTAAMRQNLVKAIRLASDLPDKNALFTARYNFANRFLQYDPLAQVKEFESLLELAEAPTLRRFPLKLYERTAFAFRNARPSVFYQLMQINLLLTDYDNAGKFADLFYDATVRPNPEGSQAPYFNAEMAIVRCYQGDYGAASQLLEKSRRQFNMPEQDIPYMSYFVAAGLLAEHRHNYSQAEQYFKKFAGKQLSSGLHLLPPELYYAHILTLRGKYNEAGAVFNTFAGIAAYRKFTATGFYYHKYYAELLEAVHDYPAYVRELNDYYSIKDSLGNLNRYRAVQEILAHVRMRDKEREIERQKSEILSAESRLRNERLFYGGATLLAGTAITMLVLLLRSRRKSAWQEGALYRAELERVEKERLLDRITVTAETEERERRKVAEQLHNEVNAMLAAASLNVSSALSEAPESQRSRLERTLDAIVTVSATIRDLSHQLNPILLEKLGFRKALEELGDTVNASGKVRLAVQVTGFETVTHLPASLLSDIYRIVQELIQNILRHSFASEASVQLVEHPGSISLMVEDNGVGLPAKETPPGSGIASVKRKVHDMNGQIEFVALQGGGTLVVMELPLPPIKATL